MTVIAKLLMIPLVLNPTYGSILIGQEMVEEKILIITIFSKHKGETGTEFIISKLPNKVINKKIQNIPEEGIKVSLEMILKEETDFA